jgi:hypothetical protein
VPGRDAGDRRRGGVISAPTVTTPELGTDEVHISGGFTPDRAEELAAALAP